MQQQSGRNWWKVFGLTVLIGGGLLVMLIALIVGLVAFSAPTGKDTHNEPRKPTEGNSQPSESKPEAAKEEQPPESTLQKQPAVNVESDVNAYYQAAASGDFVYTYGHLTQTDQQTYTLAEWVEANTTLGSGSAAYEVTDIREVSEGVYDVDIIAGGEARTTQFVLEDSQYVHKLTGEEYAMFDGALASASASAPASASASASAAPSADAGSGEVDVRVEVKANEPVDVSIISAEDADAPLINEQVQSQTYNFPLNEGADLSVSASDPKMDFTGDSGIEIKVYENGKLKSEDTDPEMALVQY